MFGSSKQFLYLKLMRNSQKDGKRSNTKIPHFFLESTIYLSYYNRSVQSLCSLKTYMNRKEMFRGSPKNPYKMFRTICTYLSGHLTLSSDVSR